MNCVELYAAAASVCSYIVSHRINYFNIIYGTSCAFFNQLKCRNDKGRVCLSTKNSKYLRRLNNHVGTRVALANELCISKSTLNTIFKNRKAIEESALVCGSASKKRKYVRTSTYEEMEEILTEWFLSARASNLPINGSIIREKALQIASRLHIEDFKASNGWIDRFKKRHNIVYKTVSGESKSVNPEHVDDWKKKIPELIAGYKAQDIFNIDETGLFFSALPSKTMCFKGENCHGGKLSKNRLTVLLTVNADGSEKLQPLVIGKFNKPRCFKNIKSFPTRYVANNKAWMTARIFEHELIALNRKMASKNRKIILFLDRCPAHPATIELSNVKLVFLPANCTSHLQPLDLGIIRSFKALYRQNLVQKAVWLLDTKRDPSKMKINVLQALHFIAKSWFEVKESTIENCFKKSGLHPLTAKEAERVDMVDFSDDLKKLACEVSAENYTDIDKDVATVEIPSIESMMTQSSDEDEEDADDPENEVDVCQNYDAALSCIEQLKNFALKLEDVSESDLRGLYNIESAVQRAKAANARQTKISDFFKSFVSH